jgi:hypothetical protein
MNKNDIINTVEQFVNKKEYDAIVPLVDEYFQQHPQEVDLRIQLAIFFTELPIADERESIRILEDTLKIDQGNPIALVILAYIYDRLWSGISEDLYNQLEHAKTYNDETKGMIELAKAWYYATGWYRERANEELYEKHLLSSVKYGNKFVWNCIDLADFYRKKGLTEKQLYYAKKAFENIQKTYTIQNPRYKKVNTIITIEDFLNELVKGTHINDSQIKIVYGLLNP